MKIAPRLLIMILVGPAGALCVGSALADKPAAAVDLAVDQVAIKGGPRLAGAILGREAGGALAVAVNRQWLQKAHPEFFAQAVRDETAETRAALTELRDRIAAWRKARAPENEFDFFLKQETSRVEKALQELDAGKRVEDAPFLVIDVAPGKVERVVSPPLPRKAVAQAAWLERLADVETRSAGSLTQELKKLRVEPNDDPDALLDLLPPRRENDAAWAARQAIVEYRYRKPLDFQGTGDMVLRAGGKLQVADAGKLISELLKSLTGDSLQDLLDPAGGKPARPNRAAANETWLTKAAEAAAGDGASGFRVTRVEQDVAARRVAVETQFVARLPDGSWKSVWQRRETADSAKVRPDAEQQIMQDPQVRTALDLFQSLGVGGEDQIRLAVRFGAATMEAQKQADGRFFEFRDRYLRRLDGPVLRVPPTALARPAKK